MRPGRRAIRLATTAAVRAPSLWRILRRPVEATFDRLAPEWDATRIDANTHAPVRAALAAIDAAGGAPSRVLDVGTGSGAVARAAAARWPDADVLGVDLSHVMIDEARRLAASSNERYEVADASALAFPDGAFDLVTLSNMIPFFDELERVTAAGGFVVVAYSRGSATPIWVPLDRVERELGRRGIETIETLSVPPGLALLARKPEHGNSGRLHSASAAR